MELEASGAGMAFDTLPPVTRSWIDTALESDETIFWIGQPCLKTIRQRSRWQGLFGLALLGGVGAFYGWDGVRDGLAGYQAFIEAADQPFSLYFWMILLFGLLFLVPLVVLGRTILESLWAVWCRPAQARTTAYLITDRRALIFWPDAWSRLASREEYRASQLASGHFISDVFPAGCHVVLHRTWPNGADTDDAASHHHGFLCMTRADADSASQCLQRRLQSPAVVTPS